MRELALPQPKQQQQTLCMPMIMKTRDHVHRVKTVSSLSLPCVLLCLCDQNFHFFKYAVVTTIHAVLKTSKKTGKT